MENRFNNINKDIKQVINNFEQLDQKTRALVQEEVKTLEKNIKDLYFTKGQLAANRVATYIQSKILKMMNKDIQKKEIQKLKSTWKK